VKAAKGDFEDCLRALPLGVMFFLIDTPLNISTRMAEEYTANIKLQEPGAGLCNRWAEADQAELACRDS
jgi:hypothetical protein